MGRRGQVAGSLFAVAAAAVAVWLSQQDTVDWVPAPPLPAAPATADGPVAGLLDRLPVRPEDRAADYDRDDWTHWSLVDGDCDAREALLRRQGTGVRVDEHCEVLSGRWVSPYDGEVHTDPSELDADHVVALSEAVDSGAAGWTDARKERYANDLRNLVAVTASVNRSKGDDDPAEWRPPRVAAECRYATTVIEVKHGYRLSVDRAERAALRSMLTTC